LSVESFDNVLNWAVDLEDEARQQAIRSAAMPFVEKPLALMPDAHFGMGATIGSVIATTGAIIPAAVDQVGRFLNEKVKPREHINCHHNFTQMEHHHGKDVWLTRKGAIKASKGDKGVIPGSMGTSSYIVSGLGNPASYESCSHGAGRRMSRTKARKEITVERLREEMKGKSWNEKDALTLLDEAPEAYKSIDVVMEAQKDLVKIDHTLHQILNYKGVS